MDSEAPVILLYCFGTLSCPYLSSQQLLYTLAFFRYFKPSLALFGLYLWQHVIVLSRKRYQTRPVFNILIFSVTLLFYSSLSRYQIDALASNSTKNLSRIAIRISSLSNYLPFWSFHYCANVRYLISLFLGHDNFFQYCICIDLKYHLLSVLKVKHIINILSNRFLLESIHILNRYVSWVSIRIHGLNTA